MFRREDWPEVVWVDIGVGAIPPFKIDVVTACKRIGFNSESSGAEAYEKIKSGEEL